MLLLERHSSFWAILFPCFIQRPPNKELTAVGWAKTIFPSQIHIKEEVKRALTWYLGLGVNESSWESVPVPVGSSSSSAWRSRWQPVWEAGSLWHLLLRDSSRWRLTFCFAACSTPSSLCQKPSDQLVCWSCSNSQSRDSPSDKQMDICCSQWGGGRQDTDGTVD